MTTTGSPPAVDTLPQLLTAQQVAGRFGLSNKLVYLLAARGDLPVVRISKRAVRFDVYDVLAWLKERKSPASCKGGKGCCRAK